MGSKKKKIAIGTTIAGVLILGITASTVYAADWDTASNEYLKSYNEAITAKEQLEESRKAYNEVKDIKAEDLTSHGNLTQTSLKSIMSSDDHHYYIVDNASTDPSWTQVTSWDLKSQAKELHNEAESMKSSANNIKNKIKVIKEEKSRQEAIKAKTSLLSRLKDAEKLYFDSNGNVDDESSRKALKQWINKTKALLDDKNLSESKTYKAKSIDSETIFNAVNQSVKSHSNRIAEESALAAIQASYVQPEQSESSNIPQAYQVSQPSYDTSSYYQPQSQYTQQQTAAPSSTPKYGSTVDSRCTVPDDSWVNTCQGAVDQGGMVDIDYYGGKTHIYSQHNGTGGAWINDLKPGDTVSFGGKNYTVNDYSEQGATTVPFDGVYAQTCNENGNHLVGLTPKN